MRIINASIKHRDFILEANKRVNEVSGLDNSRLDEFIEQDLFCKNPKFYCLIAEENGQAVGMCI